MVFGLVFRFLEGVDLEEVFRRWCFLEEVCFLILEFSFLMY